MKIRTGQTISEAILSVDTNNNPISAATLTVFIYKNGVVDTGTTTSTLLTDESNAIFTTSWSASSLGSYQLYVKNDTTNVLYMSEVYLAVSDGEEIAAVYVGI